MIWLRVLFSLVRLLLLVGGVIVARACGFPPEQISYLPDGVKQVPTRYRFSMSAAKRRWKWKRRLR
jgi:hypothetical protein